MAGDDGQAPAVFFDRGIPELTGYMRMIGRPVPVTATNPGAACWHYESWDRRPDRPSGCQTPS